MLTISEAIRTYIVAQSTFTALASDRLYPERADQDAEAPYVTYHIELRDAAPVQGGPTLLIEATVDFIVLSRGYDEAFAIAEVLRALMTDFRGVMGGTSGVDVQGVTWEETLGGYIPGETAELGLFGSLAKFTVLYIPQ